FRPIGCGYLLSSVAAFFINVGLGGKTLAWQYSAGVEDLLDKLRSIKRDGGIQGDARDAYVESHAEDHFDGILKTTLSPQCFSKRIGIHTIQSISGFAAQEVWQKLFKNDKFSGPMK
ncbi:hypothetical protein Tco_0179921, partial [Tanacetum coccineum]